VLLAVDWAPNEHEGDNCCISLIAVTSATTSAASGLRAKNSIAEKRVDITLLDDYVVDRIAKKIRATVERRP
jgi:hypothetical protein